MYAILANRAARARPRLWPPPHRPGRDHVALAGRQVPRRYFPVARRRSSRPAARSLTPGPRRRRIPRGPAEIGAGYERLCTDPTDIRDNQARRDAVAVQGAGEAATTGTVSANEGRAALWSCASDRLADVEKLLAADRK